MILALLGAALLAATPATSAPPPAAAALFPKVEGFRLADGPTRYTPATLYEYINGGADAFLQYDFEELATATYAAPDKTEVTIDIYRHRDAVRAFGMYLQERPSAAKPLAVGIEGHEGDQCFGFVAGAYYVKLTGKTALLRGFAEKIAALLPGTREPPAVFKAFPAAGRQPRSEKLATRDFLGHAFLHDGFTVVYESDGGRFRLFAIQGKDDADAREMLKRYFAVAKSSDAPKAEGAATIKDPLNGPVDLLWRGRWICGAVDQPSKGRAALVQELSRALK